MNTFINAVCFRDRFETILLCHKLPFSHDLMLDYIGTIRERRSQGTVAMGGAVACLVQRRRHGRRAYGK